MNVDEAVQVGSAEIVLSAAPKASAVRYSGPKLGNLPPPLAHEAYCGYAGEFVRLVEPNSEADPAALLSQFLVVFGNAVGRGPHVFAEADEHHACLFVTVVGDSSKARKGSSWGHVRQLFEAVDPDWKQNHIARGLSTGEGLIHRVRDASKSDARDVADAGVADKRLLVVESELARPLKAADRQGNTVSSVLRCAWDGEPLQIMTKTNAITATDAHISVIGHITIEELLKVLSRTDVANGFANRFLWMYSRRSKLLPDGSGTYDVGPLVEKLQDAIAKAKRVGRVNRDDESQEMWRAIYPKLSQPHPGDLGKVTARSEAQVNRLSLLFALLDGSHIIRPVHLKAALAVWRHAEYSAAYIFGSPTSGPTAKKILDHVEFANNGMTRTEISELFDRHRSADEIDSVRTYLSNQGFVYCKKVPTAGRTKEVWFATCEKSE